MRFRHGAARWAALAVVSSAWLGSAVPAWAGKDSIPDWVRAAIAEPQPKYAAETPAVILLDEMVLAVGKDGRAVERHRRVVKILRPSGRDEGYVGVPFDSDTKLLSMKVWSVGPDGHEYQVKDSDIVEVGYPGQGNFYTDEKIRVANAPGRDPGGVVAYEYEQRQPTYTREDTWQFQGELPRIKQSFTLELPAGYTYATSFAHHDAVKAADLENGRTRWEMDEVPSIDLERVPMHPSMQSMAGRLTIHYAPPGVAVEREATWQGIGSWYDGLSHDRLAANAEIAAKAAELTAGKTDFYDKAEAIGDFVRKQIRYFVIERGIGGMQPHAAAEIFHNRYGDCKDKSTVLSAMLSTVGIHSVIVLVDSHRGVVDPTAPSAYGDHAIAAIEIPKGYESPKLRSVVTLKSGRRYLIFDPTWEMTAFGQLEKNLQGSYGLVVEGTQSEIVELPVLSPELNTVRRSAKLTLAADGSLTGSIVERRFGDVSERERRRDETEDAKAQKVALDRRLSRDFQSFDATDVRVENVASLNKDLTTSYTITAPRYVRAAGPLLMVRPRVLGSEGLPFDRKNRRVPIDLEQTMQARDDFTIELPAGYAVDELPEPVRVDLGFAAYESRTELTGTTLHYTRTYTVRQVSLPPERYADFQKLASIIDADEQSAAVFKKQ